MTQTQFKTRKRVLKSRDGEWNSLMDQPSPGSRGLSVYNKTGALWAVKRDGGGHVPVVISGLYLTQAQALKAVEKYKNAN